MIKIDHNNNLDANNINPIEQAQCILPYYVKDPNDFHKQQINVFEKLERGINFVDAISLRHEVNFKDAFKTPIQRWYPYREGYSQKLVNYFINKLDARGIIFDPFSGSGTTLLSARNNDLESIGIDVNPISVLVSETENEVYNSDDIAQIKKIISYIKQIKKSNSDHKTSFSLADKTFNHDILQSLLQLKNEIASINSNKVRKLVFVSWLSIIESVSNFKKEGNGIKYKNRKRTVKGYTNIPQEIWENKYFPVDKFNYVKGKLIEKLEIILFDIINYYGSVNIRPRIYESNCLDFDKLFKEEIGFTFFSPPYCNSFDYFEIHKVELWLGDFVTSKEQMRNLKVKGFRSNTSSLNNKYVTFKNEYLEILVSLFDSSKLWSKRIPNVVRGYFDDFNTLLIKLYNQTADNGYVGIVVGNSAYSGVIIPTDVLIADIAREIGFEIECLYITRHLTTSSQQKLKLEPLKQYLRESILLLKKRKK